jgi:hypothetical protein
MKSHTRALPWLALLLLLPWAFLSAYSQGGSVIQHAEIKAVVLADGGFSQTLPLASGGAFSSFSPNGTGNFGWQFTNTTGAPLQNVRFIVFLDADIDRNTNTFFNEFGELVSLSLPPGAPAGAAVATSWEIDEPGFLFGNIAPHVMTGMLDNTNEVPAAAPNDVSLALGYQAGTLAPGAGFTGTFFISPSAINGLKQTDPNSNASFFFNGYLRSSSTPPTIVTNPLTRQQGSGGTSAVIATVSDDQTPAANLQVVALAVPPGISLNNLTNNNGSISAVIGTTCTATLGANTVVLQVTDGSGQTATQNLIVTLTANTPPVLGVYLSASVQPGGNTVISPNVPPTDNGFITGLAVSAPTFAGNLSINPTTGVITVSNAAPNGNHTITVNATDNCGAMATRVFMLQVATGVGLGDPLVASNKPGGQKPGSVLIYNLYSSSVSRPQEANTRINMTNTEPTQMAYLHVFLLDSESCTAADFFVCLTPNQTFSFLTSEYDPEVTGYIIAVAVNQNTGCPTQFNYLIGDEYVKLTSGHAANLTAESFSALVPNPVNCDPNASTATLAFDNQKYNAMPRTLAVDNIASPADGNSTMLILNRLDANVDDVTPNIGLLFGILYNDRENGYSFNLPGTGCQLRTVLSNGFPRTSPPFNTIISAGRSGWMRFWATNDTGMLGAVINFNAKVATSPSAYNQGRNLRHLTYTTNTKLILPVIAPVC